MALLGQEGSGLRLKKESDNQHVVGWGMWQGAGVGGGTRKAVQGGMASATAYTVASVTAAIGNDFPHVSVKLVDPLQY